MASTQTTETYLAFDLGAESGRAFLGSLREGKLDIREIHRFVKACRIRRHYSLGCQIWLEMRRALASVDTPRLAGIGVDAFGVDCALLGQRGELLQNPFNCRDPRNVSAMDEVLARVPRSEIYRNTGTQFMVINTLYQLYAAQRDTPKILAAAEKLIMVPDLFHYWMTGNAVCEYTDASTTQFMNPITRKWAVDLLDRLGLPSWLPAEIVEPGTVVGHLLPGVSRNASLNGTPVIAPGSHDTASAVRSHHGARRCGVHQFGHLEFGSGTELPAPILTDEAMCFNFTECRGVVFAGPLTAAQKRSGSVAAPMLQAMPGLQRRERITDYPYLADEAAKAAAFRSLIVNPDSALFLSPSDMPRNAIDEYCRPDGPTDSR